LIKEIPKVFLDLSQFLKLISVMNIKEVPQDNAGFLKEGKVRDVCYAVDDEGNYTRVLSVGWDPKNEAIRQAWEQVGQKAEKIRQKVLSGKLSPLAFHMVKGLMSKSLLAQYTGYSRWKIRKHMKPSVFNTLSDEQLGKYAEALNIPVEILKKI
ncbi:MAG TPA: hypothetical protein PKW80_06125, partial [Bacteroidales bacterium]|nr:hypothetical protein [Bacteroidales bacterium]